MKVFLVVIAILAVYFTGYGSSVSDVSESGESVGVKVVRVVDGDTIVVLVDGVEQAVRYIGVDTPEPYSNGTPDCFSFESTQRNKELVSGKSVRLEKDESNTDRYGRLLRYVYVDEDFINEILIKEGYAISLTIYPDTTYAKSFLELEKTAKKEKVGRWKECQ